ncbi:MAG: carbamoyl-phosphate synthase large subunit [Clostridiales bacterium]|jgi:carbamoyl-phosphate synthase large subunit|nr:carbamoyl-phosphate synthase large subunit [Clostridiales bacterium]
MPRDNTIKKVLVVGSGPIVIGQAAEFDYAGTQACRALREEGIEIVLINSNPATIMTDKAMADRIYIEPLTVETIKRIIEKEKPDSILSGLGGQTGLTLCMKLAKDGILKRNGVRLLGASPETIDKAEDRQIFKDTMLSIGQPCIPSVVVTDLEAAEAFAGEIGYPVIIRPSFTLGGSGGGIVYNLKELRETAGGGLALSPIHQVLVEKCVSGWKEIEFEVMRDGAGNVITVCSMENFDPVGIHTGDSVVIAPAVTLADKDYQMLRRAALDIITVLGVEGGCNVQFALHPDSFEYAVIEVNPRVSRSSALASKATGYPIAKVATKIAIGYRLDEIMNAVTGKTYAAFEPTLDYVAVKFPKWPFDKFVYAKRELGTQMKATGEVMAIADTFEAALMKAVRGVEIGLDTLTLKTAVKMSDGELRAALLNATDERVFAVYEAVKRGITIDEIYETTKIDKWFLCKLRNIAETETALAKKPLSSNLVQTAKRMGFTDAAIRRIGGKELKFKFAPVYKMVDTCAGEFGAATPYFYGIFNGAENEALPLLNKTAKQTVVVLGSGPIRIGQGIEFDYSSVHCVRALKKLGYEVVIINNNPETVSTDFDIADRLYFEPLTGEDVVNILNIERPAGVVAAFGGQTAIKLTKYLHAKGVNIIGTSADSIDMAEDRERFDSLLERLKILRPKGFTVETCADALKAARELGYPVLMRPSYVLGGQNMIIAFNDEDIAEYMEIILRQKQDNPVLIDKYLSGREIEVDAICDGENILIPGIMEHIERTGIHSGDSCAVYPPAHIDDTLSEKIVEITQKLCAGLNAVGMINLQYIIIGTEIYVIEVNPRASRTVPYISKVTDVPMCELAVRVSLGEKLPALGYGTGLYKRSPYTAVKVPVFSFEKLTDVDTHLGPEMKSTGEVLGIGKNLQEALFKGLIAAGYKMHKSGGVFITVRDGDKGEIADIAKKYAALGFSIFATDGTAATLERKGLKVTRVCKIRDNPDDNTMTLLEGGKISTVISTSARGRNPRMDDVKIRRKAVSLGIPCLTSLDTAAALADSLMSRYGEKNTELVDINTMRGGKVKIKFVKMQGAGNDYIYIDCFEQDINSPESLSIFLSDRHYGIGSDGVILICPSATADAKMRMFNLDGSEGKMCGNGIRCVAKYLYDSGRVPKKEMRIETLSGVKLITLTTKNSLTEKVTVDMGRAELDPAKIPVNLSAPAVGIPVRLSGEAGKAAPAAGMPVRSSGEEGKAAPAVDIPIAVGGRAFRATFVSMGNPHCVIFCDDAAGLDLNALGPAFENEAALFPESVNTEFIEVVGPNALKMRVWERGSGETLACGTGACAAVVAAVLNGHCKKGADVTVTLNGGELVVNYTDERVLMTGGAEKVFEGVVEI